MAAAAGRGRSGSSAQARSEGSAAGANGGLAFAVPARRRGAERVSMPPLVRPLARGRVPRADRVSVHAPRPTPRCALSVQLRAAGTETRGGCDRSTSTRRRARSSSRFADMRRSDGKSAERPCRSADVDSLLFVVDTVNTRTGRPRHGAGSSEARLERLAAGRSGADGQQQVGGAGAEDQVGRPGRQHRREHARRCPIAPNALIVIQYTTASTMPDADAVERAAPAGRRRRTAPR